MPLMLLFWAIGLLLAGYVAVLALNFVAELAQGDSADDALMDTRRLAAAILGGFVALLVTGVLELSSLLGGFANLLAMKPTGLTNLFAAGLGALGISGAIRISPSLYLAVTLGFLGLALLSREVLATDG